MAQKALHAWLLCLAAVRCYLISATAQVCVTEHRVCDACAWVVRPEAPSAGTSIVQGGEAPRLMATAPARCSAGSLAEGTARPASHACGAAEPSARTATPRPCRRPPRQAPSHRSPAAVCRTP